MKFAPLTGSRLFACLLLATPVALAQTGPPIRVEVADQPAAIGVLVESPPAKFSVTVDCTTLVAQEGASVHLWVARAPPFARARLIPSEFTLDMSACRARPVQLDGTVVLTLDERAPAHRPQSIDVSAAIEGLATSANVSASDAASFTPAYFAILNVQLDEAIRTVRPGESTTFVVRVANHGNGRTHVDVGSDSVSGGLTVDPVARVTLDAAQQGGSQTAANVALVVHASPGGGPYVNEVGVATFRVSASDAEGAGKGDETSVSVVVTTKGANVPGPSVALALAAALALALARRLKA